MPRTKHSSPTRTTAPSPAAPSPSSGRSPTGANCAKISPTRENYLKFIYLEERQNGYARACNLTEALGVTRSTVALTFRELKADGLIEYAPYSPIHLTDKGRALAEKIVRRYEQIKLFCGTVLDLDDAASSKVACELEHVLSDAVIERLRRFSMHIDYHRSLWEKHEGKHPADRPADAESSGFAEAPAHGHPGAQAHGAREPGGRDGEDCQGGLCGAATG